MKKLGFYMVFLMMLFSVSTIQLSAATIKGTKTEVDTSHLKDGYVNVRALAPNEKALKVIITKGDGKYTYDLPKNGTTVSYPLQMGNGKYELKVMENVTDNKYSVIQSCTLDVALSSEYAPYLFSNQYVQYEADSSIVKVATQITKGCTTDMEKVDKIYAYVADLIEYDTNKASTVKPGYLPNVDQTLTSKKGICFDYAAVMAAMLRSQNIPTKLVTGYVSPNNIYHAWNESYIKGIGWVKTGDIYFDGNTWKIMDSTFLSSSQGSEEIKQYIGNGGNYTKKNEY